MPNANETFEIPRKVLPIIYVLDTSESMAGERIAAVNEAMNETMEVLRDVSEKDPDVEIKIGVLKFSTNAEWATEGLILTDDFDGANFQTGGIMNLGHALEELNSKLSRSEFLVSDTGFCVPVLIFIGGGQPTDNYQQVLDEINATNKWFRCANKIAIAVGEDADRGALEKIVGNKEAVIAVNDVETLKSLLKVASLSVLGVCFGRIAKGQSTAEERFIQAQVKSGEETDKLETNFEDWIAPTSITPPADNNTFDNREDWDNWFE